MAIGRVAKKLYAQQGEFGTLRKAYKEAFRRQAISNYAPANIVGRMFGFGSIFHTMAKKAFGTPEWDPRALETGRPNVPAGRGGGSFRPSSTMSNRLSDALLGDIAENTDRTASALEDMENIQARMEKKLDISENTKREEDFESALKKLQPLPEEKLTKGGRTSPIGGSPGLLGGIGAGLAGLSGGALGALAGGAVRGAGRFLLRFGPVGMLLGGLYDGISEYMKSGDIRSSIEHFFSGLTFGLLSPEWMRENFLVPLSNMIQNAVDTAKSYWEEFKKSSFGNFLARPFQSTDGDSALDSDYSRDFFNPFASTNTKPTTPIKLTGRAAAESRKSQARKLGTLQGRARAEATKSRIRAASTMPEQTIAPAAIAGGAASASSVAPAATQKTNLTGIEGNLLNAIASAEASPSGYDGVFGSRERSPEFAQLTNGRRLTELTVSEVMALQPRLVRLNAQKGGNKREGGAVGRYQIVTNTLKGLVKEMGLTGNEMFSPELQDRMAITLLNRRGLQQFKAGKISAAEFQNNLSEEWAGLPNVTGRSFYEDVGTNKHTVSSAFLQAAITGTGKLNVPAATAATRTTQVAAASAASTTSLQATMSTPEAVGTTIMSNIPTSSTSIPPQMGESVDEFVTRVLVAMGVVTQT